MSRGRLIVAVTVVVVTFAGLVVFSQTNNAPVDYGQYRISNIKTLADRQFDYELNPDKIYEASEDTGGLPEKVIGDPSKAKVVLYEYADYACAHCAEWSRSLDYMVEKSNGDLAVVYRGYLLPGFKNNLVAASAATTFPANRYDSSLPLPSGLTVNAICTASPGLTLSVPANQSVRMTSSFLRRTSVSDAHVAISALSFSVIVQSTMPSALRHVRIVRSKLMKICALFTSRPASGKSLTRIR